MNDYLEFDNLNQALKHFINRILDKDLIVSKNAKNKDTYKKDLIELHPIFFKLKNPKQVIFDLPKYKCIPYWYVGEIMTEMLGMNPPLMNNYRSDIVDWSYDLLESGRACYGYGCRWLNHNSIEKTYERLKDNPTSKRCYVPIFDQNDVGNSLDAPCNLGFSFLSRNNKLDLSLFTRSIDITKGFRYDFSLFSFIQQSMSAWLDMDLGNMFYYCNSLHCYGKDINKVKNLKEYFDNNNIVKNVELNIDKNMEIGKTYNDLRKVAELENIVRNTNINIDKEINNLNYNFSRDFIRVFKEKNVKK